MHHRNLKRADTGALRAGAQIRKQPVRLVSLSRTSEHAAKQSLKLPVAGLRLRPENRNRFGYALLSGINLSDHERNGLKRGLDRGDLIELHQRLIEATVRRERASQDRKSTRLNSSH